MPNIEVTVYGDELYPVAHIELARPEAYNYRHRITIPQEEYDRYTKMKNEFWKFSDDIMELYYRRVKDNDMEAGCSSI
jgi:hypothetical protein